MNKDRLVGAGREMLGDAERGIGDASGNDRLQGEGVVDQVAGAVQHGYGVIKDATDDLVDRAPGAAAHAADRGRALVRQGDEAVRERLGDNGPLYLLGGALALFALGAFVLTRPSSAPAPRRKSAAKSRKPKPGATAG